MFSEGHLIWVGISAALIAGGLAACLRLRPARRKLMLVCLVLGILSEVVKFFLRP